MNLLKKLMSLEGGFKIKTTRSEYAFQNQLYLAPGKVPNMLGLENESDILTKEFITD